MKFINISAVTEKGLNKKVNAFLEEIHILKSLNLIMLSALAVMV
ncbi:hypothetical protein PYH68_12985 [Staphylococcus xylosus]